MKKLSIVLIAIAGMASLTVLTAQTPATQTASSKPAVGVEIGNLAPEINLATPDGKNLALSSLRGNVVLIDFWASWCRPC